MAKFIRVLKIVVFFTYIVFIITYAIPIFIDSIAEPGTTRNVTVKVIYDESVDRIDFCGTWDDGVFFVATSDAIDIYDGSGAYLYTLHLSDGFGGAIYSRAVGSDEIELVGVNSNQLLRIKRTGEVIECNSFTDEEQDEKIENFNPIYRGLFITKTVYLGNESQAVLKVPPYFTLPKLPNSCFDIYSSDEDGAERLYSDDCRSVYEQYTVILIMVGIFLMLMISTVISEKYFSPPIRKRR